MIRYKKWEPMGQHQINSIKITEPYAKKVKGGWVVIAPVKTKTFNHEIFTDKMSAVKKLKTEKECIEYIKNNYPKETEK